MIFRFRRPAATTTAALATLLSAGLAGSAGASVLNHSAAFRWKGYVSTALPMSSFYGSAHSVAFKFMAQYPAAYQGPLFTTSVDGNYLIGMGNFSEGTNGVKLQVTFGGETAYFSQQNVPTDLLPGKWNSLVVVKQNGKYKVWLNAQLLSRDGCSSGCTELDEGNVPVSGNVRFGRKGSGNAQFYGFMDDILVFDRALSAFEVWIVSGVTRASGNESGLLRGWTFDTAQPNGDPNPPTIHSGNFVAPAYRTLVSEARDSAFDAKLLPPPTVTVDLPFTKGVAWKVSQGYATTTGPSHYGNAAFFWDLVRSNVGNPQTCGSSLRAAAAGTLFHGYDWGGDLDPDDDITGDPYDAYNDLKIELDTPGEYLRYLHVLTGSIRAAFGLNDLPPSIPSFWVAKGAKVAEAGTREANNCHLHFGYSNGAVSIPLGYNYERWESSNGGYWTAIQNGLPAQDEIIRRP
jgi:hypothetical protein